MTQNELREFDEIGFVTIDTPLTAAQVAAAAEAMDRLLPFDGANPRPSKTCDFFDSALVEVLEHPFFEEVAKEVLLAERIYFFQDAIQLAYPEPAKPFSFWQHVDMQYRTDDFEAVPRNILCSFFLWLSDVDETTAPMMVRPGSHLVLAKLNQQKPAEGGYCPRVAPTMMSDLPRLDFADPVPITARAGQVSVVTTSTVHGASVNVGNRPRRNFVFTFHSVQTKIGLSESEEKQKREYHCKLRPCLRTERAYIIPNWSEGE